MEELKGNRDGSIYRDGEAVIRPLNAWSPTIHKLLQHLQNSGFSAAPKFISSDEQCEWLSFVEGTTADYPLTGQAASLSALKSAARLLRRFHDASESFLNVIQPKAVDWMLSPVKPFEVICHGDFAPYNVAFTGNEVSGVFDFDTAHPGPRVWDLAYAIYCWSPFKTNPADAMESVHDQIARARSFCDAYGATEEQRTQLPDMMVNRLQALVDFMTEEANRGSEQFSENIEDGHHLHYLNDIQYIAENKAYIRSGLISA